MLDPWHGVLNLTSLERAMVNNIAGNAHIPSHSYLVMGGL